MATPRREFLYLCLGGSSTLVFGCAEADADDSETGDSETAGDGDGDGDGEPGDGDGDSEPGDGDGDEPGACADPFAGGTLIASFATFVGEAQGSVGVFEGEGLDGRLALDLGTLDADTLLTASDDFFIRTALPDQLDLDQAWSLTLDGLVAAPVELSLEQLAALEQVSRVVLLECSGNGGGRAFGLISAAEWSGVPLSAILEFVEIDASATAVLIEGFDQHSQPSEHSTPGCSWVFRFEELSAAGAILATHMNGEPLPLDHGYPLRLIIPGWYGCCNPKWVDRIRLVDASEPATTQMLEFASRTHQSEAHALAASYAPGLMQQAAMPVRIEQWTLGDQTLYKIVGIMWGGSEPTQALAIQFDGGDWLPVEICPAQADNDTWTLWSYAWDPPAPGTYEIRMRIDDPAVPTLRLDSGFYSRSVTI